MRHLFGTAVPTVAKKTSEAIDRGLVKWPVKMYARKMGVTYEDAHQILSAAKSLPEVPSVSPSDKWEQSLFDKGYRKERARACRKTLEVVRGHFG
jgi:hypothetical protein